MPTHTYPTHYGERVNMLHSQAITTLYSHHLLLFTPQYLLPEVTASFCPKIGLALAAGDFVHQLKICQYRENAAKKTSVSSSYIYCLVEHPGDLGYEVQAHRQTEEVKSSIKYNTFFPEQTYI